MTIRWELTEAAGQRYRRSGRCDKRRILDEFIQLTGYHRKHAIRVLSRESLPPRDKPGPQRRYDDDVRIPRKSSSRFTAERADIPRENRAEIPQQGERCGRGDAG